MRVVAVLLALGCLPAAGWAQTPPPSADPLAPARAAYVAQKFEEALPLLDNAIETLQAAADRDPAARASLVEAYEMRARARVVARRDWAGARADFQALLARSPGHSLSETTSPRIQQLFNEARKVTVGEIILTAEPPDAQIDLDDRPFVPAGAPTRLLAGEHRIRAQKSGYRTRTELVTVRAGMPAQPVLLRLERVSSTLSIMTAPAGVEVFIDGALVGLTLPGPPAGEDAEWARKSGAAPDDLSAPLVAAGLSIGSHRVELRKSCFATGPRTIDIPDLGDYRMAPVRLDPAVAAVTVTSAAPPGSTLLVDGEPRGGLPAALQGLCAGRHTFEVHTDWGGARQALDLEAGKNVELRLDVRPTFAVIAATGSSEATPAVPDLRDMVVSRLGGDGTVGLVAPAAADVARVLGEQKVEPDFLALDRLHRAISKTAVRVAPFRNVLSVVLARALDAAGVATVTVAADEPPGRVCLALLAAGSAEPDVLEVDLASQDSIGSVRARLAETPEVLEPDAGLLATDAADVTGAVVVGTENPAPGKPVAVQPGDVITAVGDQAVADAAAFTVALTKAQPGQQIPVTLVRADGTPARTSLAVGRAPRVIMASDRSLLFNKLVFDFRVRLAQASDPEEQQALRLNLAVALMGVGNWKEARAELERVNLPDRPGVSMGTVNYLLGSCAERLGEPGAAESFWRQAASANGALLSEDGPPVKDLADRKLAAIRGARR